MAREQPAEGWCTVTPIPFCIPFHAEKEEQYLADALRSGVQSVLGTYSQRSRELLRQLVGGTPFLTTSGSAALELAVLTAGVEPGDEVILPSFTFASVANAVVLRGARPVFVDIDRTTLNIDPQAVEAAVGPRTKAILAVHYAGAICDMEAICSIARRVSAVVIEDAAHAIGSTRNGRAAGSFGDLAAFSFHYTKNVTCGEGGALIVNSGELLERTQIAFEKGTNREAFLKGLVDKYTWVAAGSSFTLSELNAAMLCAQLEALPQITTRRQTIWAQYSDACSRLGLSCSRPPPGHNAHIFYLMLDREDIQERFIAGMKVKNISTPFHYVPLHCSPAGQRYGRVAGSMAVTESIWSRLVRLPLYPSLEDRDVGRVIAAMMEMAS